MDNIITISCTEIDPATKERRIIDFQMTYEFYDDQKAIIGQVLTREIDKMRKKLSELQKI
jgi:hypothetical protein